MHKVSVLTLICCVALIAATLTPAFAADIVEIASRNPNMKTFIVAVKAAGLVDTLKGAGPFTVFIPTDAAFARLPKGTLENLLKPENRARLQAILKYHVMRGNISSAAVKKLKNGSMVKTLEGGDIKVTHGKTMVMVNNALVTVTDLKGSNGTIHVIDAVLLPPKKQ